MEYLLSWANYPESEQSWQPRGNMMCDSLLDAYNNKRAEKIEDEQQNIVGDIDDLRDNIKALGDLVTNRIQKTQIDEGRYENSEVLEMREKNTNKCELCQQMFASGFSLKRQNQNRPKNISSSAMNAAIRFAQTKC